MNKIFFFFVILIFISACDKIEPPYKMNNSNNNDTTTFVQKVLIEDFTGHRCGNCPRAHEKLSQLISLYGDKVIGLAWHSGFFANPLPPDYPADYRTPEAEEIANAFGVTQWPMGMVNRTPYNGNILLSYDAWSEAVANFINQTPKAYIAIQANYQTATSQVKASVSVKLLQNIDSPIKLCVFLTEDSIISAQTDYDVNPNLISNYIHMHMFRASFNGTWGNELSLAGKQVGDTLLRQYSLTWNTAWVVKNSHVLAFIYDANSNAILQVNKATIN
ncbi:MAG: Omp28 family outer membrane lipoprotein [Bacteroidales bacterium]